VRRGSLLPPLVGLLLIVGVVAVTVWSVPYAATARSLYLFEQEAPTAVAHGSARQGAGLLGLDLVTLDDGRTVDVHRQGEPRVQWPRPEFLVGEHGARYVDEAPSSGAWGPFAVRAVTAWLAALVVLAGTLPWVVRGLASSSRDLGFAVFGQRASEARPVTFVPGAGGTGGGGQVPPIVPYDPDWDPDGRIR
jgi:hypothetical protein